MAAQSLAGQFRRAASKVGLRRTWTSYLAMANSLGTVDLERISPFARAADRYVVGFVVDVDDSRHAGALVLVMAHLILATLRRHQLSVLKGTPSCLRLVAQ